MGLHLDEKQQKVQSLVSRMLALSTGEGVSTGNAAIQRRSLEASIISIPLSLLHGRLKVCVMSCFLKITGIWRPVKPFSDRSLLKILVEIFEGSDFIDLWLDNSGIPRQYLFF